MFWKGYCTCRIEVGCNFKWVGLGRPELEVTFEQSSRRREGLAEGGGRAEQKQQEAGVVGTAE